MTEACQAFRDLNWGGDGKRIQERRHIQLMLKSDARAIHFRWIVKEEVKDTHWVPVSEYLE